MRTEYSCRRQLPRVLSEAQVRGLMAQCPVHILVGVRNRAMLESMYRAGLRCSEVLDLTTPDVDWEQQMFLVRHSKGDRSRNVPWPPDLTVWLRAWQRMREKAKITGRHFFTTWKGGRLLDKYTREMLDRYAVAAGITDFKVTPHMLRHTYATELIQNGFNIMEVRDLLGHASIATTQIYLHVRPEELAAKIRLLPRRRGGLVGDAEAKAWSEGVLAELGLSLEDEDASC